jgi:hypothetical protein
MPLLRRLSQQQPISPFPDNRPALSNVTVLQAWKPTGQQASSSCGRVYR